MTRIGYARSMLEFSAIRDSIEIAEGAAAKRLDSILERSPQAMARVNVGRKIDLRLDDDGTDAWLSKELFPQVLRGALFLSSHAILEQLLTSICERGPGEEGGLRLTDLRHRGIEGARVYMTRVMDMAFPDDTRAWSHVTALARLRNHLVHQGVFVESGKKGAAVRGTVEQLQHVRLVDGDEIYLEQGFLPAALLSYEELVGEIYQRNGIELSL